MPFQYLPSPSASALQQGEILSNVKEYRPVRLRDGSDQGSAIAVDPIFHNRVLVITQGCDLLNDYNVRNAPVDPQSPGQGSQQNAEHPNILPYILLCDLYEEAEIRTDQRASIWTRIKENQLERYHRLLGASVGDNQENRLPGLYLDFKKIWAFPTDFLYQAIESSEIRRIAVVPPIYLHDLIHRFFAFHSRVAIPD